MGYMVHHAIIVTCWDHDRLSKLRDEIVSEAVKRGLAPLVGPFVESVVNGYCSFLIAPDGSKEGWAHSDDGDAFRDWVVALMESQVYDDGSTWLDWCEVQYGDEDGVQGMVRASDWQSRLGDSGAAHRGETE